MHIGDNRLTGCAGALNFKLKRRRKNEPQPHMQRPYHKDHTDHKQREQQTVSTECRVCSNRLSQLDQLRAIIFHHFYASQQLKIAIGTICTPLTV